MKKLLAISFMFLTGCTFQSKIVGPKFAVGDCFAIKSDVEKANGPLESWETRQPIRFIDEVLEVGVNKYRIRLHMAGIGSTETSSDISSDFIMVKVDCPRRNNE
jgi:hypothetical protein